MNKTFTISVGVLIILAVSFVIGYFLGRSSVDIPQPKKEVIIKWMPGKTVTNTITKLEPYAVHDTVYIDRPVPEPTDTAVLFSVWRDYYLSRDYNLDFSDDSLGVFKVQANVQENKLISATSTIKPNIRTVTERETIYKVPTMQFYTLIGTSLDLSANQIQVGVDLKQKYMIGVSGIRVNDNWGYTVNFGIKF